MTKHAVFVCIVIALAAGGAAATVSCSKLFEDFREWWAPRSYYGHLLVRCGYCSAHWLTALGIAIYRPRLVRSSAPVADIVLSALATITVATLVAATARAAYWGRRRG